MALNLKKFVNVNIVNHATSTANSVRDTAVLIWDPTTDSAFNTVFTTASNWDIYDANGNIIATPEQAVVTALGSAITSALNSGIICEQSKLMIDFTASSVAYIGVLPLKSSWNSTIPGKFVKIFFDNNGGKLLFVKKGTSYSSTISALDNKYIMVAATGAAGIADLPTLTGINQKILVNNFSTLPTDSKSNFVWKYGEKGVEATVLAYFTKIDITGNDSNKDYAFTEESVDSTNIASDSMISSIVDNAKTNGIGYLAGAYRNIGGNDSAGNDLMNQFMLIVLQQTLTERLTQTLVSKIKYDQAGINLISATISDELNVYANNGYLSRDKVWTENDYVITAGGNTYKLITRGSLLPLGYKYLILPFSTLSAAQKQAHAFPNIYVILATSYGIRFISLDGETF